MATNDETMIRQLMDELVDAWNRGDAKAYARVIAPMPLSPMSMGCFMLAAKSLIAGTMRFFAEH